MASGYLHTCNTGRTKNTYQPFCRVCGWESVDNKAHQEQRRARGEAALGRLVEQEKEIAALKQELADARWALAHSKFHSSVNDQTPTVETNEIWGQEKREYDAIRAKAEAAH